MLRLIASRHDDDDDARPTLLNLTYLGPRQTRNKVEQRLTLLRNNVACLTWQVQLLTSRAANFLDQNHLYSSSISRCVAEL